MLFTVARPFNNPDTTYFHVHAAGCRDLNARRYATADAWTIDAADRNAVIEDAYCDQIHSDNAHRDPAEVIDEFSTDFTFLPCCAALPASATNPNPTKAKEATAMTTTTITADPKFARLLDELDAEVIDGVILFTMDDGTDLQVAQHGNGWVITDEDNKILTPVLTKWECAFLVRDWDGEVPTAEPTDERKIHA